MFYQRSSLWLRAFAFSVLAIVILICDQRIDAFHQSSVRVSFRVAYPFQWLIDAPMRLSHWLALNIQSQQNLINENAKLHAETILLQAQLQRSLALEKENAQLRQLLQSTPKVGGRVTIARLLSVALDPHLQEVMLSEGSDQQVYSGQPVLDAFGVMGQVVDVGTATSRVLLITDKQSAVPVEDYRTGARAVAAGLGVSGRLILTNVPSQNDIRAGDLFVTSGLGLHYPIGYPVGVINDVKTLELTPTAHLDRAQQVLLAWPNQVALKKAIAAHLKTPVKK